MIRALTAALAAIMMMLALPAQAHKPSDSYLSLKTEGSDLCHSDSCKNTGSLHSRCRAGILPRTCWMGLHER